MYVWPTTGGVGTGHTGGRWIIEDSVFRHNTQDGLDLLYVSEREASVEIRRTVARDNAGDQIKTAGPTLVENVLAVSHCAFFRDQAFTYVDARHGEAIDHCRAGGSALALNLRRANQAQVINSTLANNGADVANSGAMTATNSTFTRVLQFEAAGKLTLASSTVSQILNGLQFDHVDFEGGQVTVTNTIIDHCFTTTPITSEGYNLDSSGGCGS